MTDAVESSSTDDEGAVPHRRKKKHRVLRVLLLSLFFVPGLILVARQLNFQTHSAVTTATVVGYQARHQTHTRGSCPKHVAYYPKGRFAAKGWPGAPATAVIENLHYCSIPKNGSTQRIRYNINDPSQAQVAGWTDTWAAPIGALLLGGIVVARIVFRS